MKQQINLYVSEFRPQLQVIRTQSIVIASIALICMLIIYQFVLATQVGTLRRTVEELENQQVVAGQRLDIVRQAARPKKSGHLDIKLKTLRKEVNHREKLGLIIESQNFGNSVGFSRAMNTLAVNSVNTIALQRIRFTSGGALLELKGDTNNPSSVPGFIQKIHEEEPFGGTLFGQLSMSPINTNVHKFSLGFETVYTERRNN